MSRSRLVATLVVAGFVGSVPLAPFAHGRVGSGTLCEGVGFGCVPERFFDTALVLLVYSAGVAATAWLCARRARRTAWALVAGLACTLAATGTAIAVQAPDHRYARGDLQSGLREWENVFDAGRRAAGSKTPLARALAALKRTGPEPCTDAYGRDTGAARYRWSYPASPYHDPGNATTGPAMAAWARLLRAGRLTPQLEQRDPEDVRLKLGYFDAPANGGVLAVRASHYIPELEISASTGCHRRR